MAEYETKTYGSVTMRKRIGEGKMSYIADRNLYLDAEGNLVEEDDPAQVRQLVGKGGALSDEVAKKHGLLKKAKEEEVDGGEKASSPSQNKAAKPTKNKGAR